MMNSTILALGLRFAREGSAQTVVDESERLLATIKEAIRSNEAAFTKGLVVSMGPKLSIMLGYTAEAKLDRALGLARAIQSSLETRAGRPPPIAGVITKR